MRKGLSLIATNDETNALFELFKDTAIKLGLSQNEFLKLLLDNYLANNNIEGQDNDLKIRLVELVMSLDTDQLNVLRGK